MRVWRIAGASYTVWSGEGARIRGGRWNPAGLPAIYAGTSYAIAALEILVHANMQGLPRDLKYVFADLPEETRVERMDERHVEKWAAPDMRQAQAYGKAWLQERRSLVLLVPSVVTRGLDFNAVINPLHPDFSAIDVAGEAPVVWDMRLRTH
jgi:RES domain-containing protein